jgi:hypothetical protein
MSLDCPDKGSGIRRDSQPGQAAGIIVPRPASCGTAWLLAMPCGLPQVISPYFTCPARNMQGGTWRILTPGGRICVFRTDGTWRPFTAQPKSSTPGQARGSHGRPPPRRANPARRTSRPLAAIAGHRRSVPRMARSSHAFVGICPPGTFIALLEWALCSANGWSDSQRSTPIPSSKRA